MKLKQPLLPFVVIFGVLLFSVLSCQKSSWNVYKNQDYHYQISYPNYFAITERAKGTYWHPDHGKEGLKRGKQVCFTKEGSSVRICVVTRFCGDETCSEFKVIPKGEPVTVNNTQFNRTSYIDNAMGERWGSNIYYTTKVEGMLYMIIFWSMYGEGISMNGESIKMEDPESDLELFTSMLQTFAIK